MYLQPGALLVTRSGSKRELFVLIGHTGQKSRDLPRGMWHALRVANWGKIDQRVIVDARMGWWLAECKELANG
jgi:hypothetical protein